jgi:hypothetical protein
VRLGHAPEVLAVGPDGVAPSTAAAAVLYAVEAHLRARFPRLLFALHHLDLSGGARRLVFALHPAGGPITLTVDEQGRASLLAHTHLAGPGYHRFLVLLAGGLVPVIGASWRPRAPRDLEARFLAWLQHQAREALAAHLEGSAAGAAQPAVRWLPPLSPEVGRFQGRGAVATVVGPRPEAWLQAVVADPRAGRDAFPWWEPGQGAAWRVGRARCLLWRELRWRPPTTEEEVAALSEVANLLAEAWEEEPDRQDLPWAAWAEVLDLLGEAPERRARVVARVRPGPPEGYRRHLVVEVLPGGWSITLPGRMGCSWDPAEGWVAWDAGRTAWVTPLAGPPPDPDPQEGTLLGTLEAPDRQARLLRLPPDEEGRPTEVLTGHVRAGEAVAAVTLAWQEDPAGRAWAEAAFRSLRRG